MRVFLLKYEVLIDGKSAKYTGKILIPADKVEDAKSFFLNATTKSLGIMVDYKDMKMMIPLGGKARVRVIEGGVYKKSDGSA